MLNVTVGALLVTGAMMHTVASEQTPSGDFLKLEATIPMRDVEGRIDHLAVDVKGRRLFVAAPGNNSIEVIDLNGNHRVHTQRGAPEPQGIAFISSMNRVFAASRKDGSVRAFDAEAWTSLKSIPFGDDADNLRVDAGTGHIRVGYGSGALAEFDVSGRRSVQLSDGAGREQPPAFRGCPCARETSDPRHKLR